MNTLHSLQAIGFSEYEAKTYLALLSNHPATGYQISKKSGVPRSMVYEVLGKLASRGAVLEAIEGRSTLYRPLHPEVLLSQHREKLESLIGDLKPELVRVFTSEEDHRAWSISGRETIFAYCREMLKKAEKEVHLVLNDNHALILLPLLNNLVKNGLSIHILSTGRNPIPFENVTFHPPLESEIQGLSHTLIVLVDKTEVLIASTPDECSATITTNPNMVLIAHQFIWMEFFTQRIYSQIGEDILKKLSPEDQEIFKSIIQHPSPKETRS